MHLLLAMQKFTNHWSVVKLHEGHTPHTHIFLRTPKEKRKMEKEKEKNQSVTTSVERVLW